MAALFAIMWAALSSVSQRPQYFQLLIVKRDALRCTLLQPLPRHKNMSQSHDNYTPVASFYQYDGACANPGCLSCGLDMDDELGFRPPCPGPPVIPQPGFFHEPGENYEGSNAASSPMTPRTAAVSSCCLA